MLAVRIIPCLDVCAGVVVKGVKFRNHRVMGDVVELARRYCDQGADELVLYDITASSDRRTVSPGWLAKIAAILDIPFCVAGGIDSLEKARAILYEGVDKISINSPALNSPQLISELAAEFGSQCVVVGIDSYYCNGSYVVYKYTGDHNRTEQTGYDTLQWACQAESLGAGEIVLNCINQDGVKNGYDLEQLQQLSQRLTIPLVASGGAGTMEHFYRLFAAGKINAALAASVFHDGLLTIPQLKSYLKERQIVVRS